MTPKRKPISYRNALTELWNDGRSVQEIAHFQGLSVEKVLEYLECARAGFNTPRYMQHAAERKAEAKAARKAR